MQIEIGTNGILVDAKLLADLLRLDPAAVHALMKAQEITSFCERGISVILPPVIGDVLSK